MNILYYILLISGVFNIIMPLAMNTKNFKSALLFKIIPFIFGVNQIIIALYLLKIINISFN